MIVVKEQILALLTQCGGYLSGQALAKELGVSRQAVWKGINALRSSGCVIESAPNKGYRPRIPQRNRHQKTSRHLGYRQ